MIMGYNGFTFNYFVLLNNVIYLMIRKPYLKKYINLLIGIRLNFNFFISKCY
jgi:hypothetical protein